MKLMPRDGHVAQWTDQNKHLIVDVTASAIANRTQIGRDAKDAINPFNHFHECVGTGTIAAFQDGMRCMSQPLLARVALAFGKAGLRASLGTPWWLGYELWDLASLPVKAAINWAHARSWESFDRHYRGSALAPAAQAALEQTHSSQPSSS